jgi:hypothetical protein
MTREEQIKAEIEDTNERTKQDNALRSELCAEMVQLCKFNVGDRVDAIAFDSRGEEKIGSGFVSSIRYDPINLRYDYALFAIKKDGTPSLSGVLIYRPYGGDYRLEIK